MLVTSVRGVAVRFQGPGGERGGGAGHELRRLGLGKGPAFGDVQPHLPQGLGDPTCNPQWPRTLGKGRKRVGTTGSKSGAGKQIGWKSRGGCIRLRGRISVPGEGTWASKGGSLARGKDYPVQRPLFLGDCTRIPHI